MFQDLDASLAALLTDPAAPADLLAADITFDTPDKDFTPAGPTLNLFLHEVAENRTLRDDSPVVTLVDGVYQSRPAALRLDCTYMTTAWSAQSGGLKAQQEHALLGAALIWLARFTWVDAQYLQAGLLNPAQPYPLATTLAQVREGQAMGQFWTALGISPRPAFSLTVTIAAQPSDDVVTAVPVQTITLQTDPT